MLWHPAQPHHLHPLEAAHVPVKSTLHFSSWHIPHVTNSLRRARVRGMRSRPLWCQCSVRRAPLQTLLRYALRSWRYIEASLRHASWIASDFHSALTMKLATCICLVSGIV